MQSVLIKSLKLPNGTNLRFLGAATSSSSALKTAFISNFFRLLKTKLGPWEPLRLERIKTKSLKRDGILMFKNTVDYYSACCRFPWEPGLESLR